MQFTIIHRESHIINQSRSYVMNHIIDECTAYMRKMHALLFCAYAQIHAQLSPWRELGVLD